MREKQYSPVWYAFNPAIHPTNKELGATKMPHLSYLPGGDPKKPIRKQRKKGGSVNSDVVFLH